MYPEEVSIAETSVRYDSQNNSVSITFYKFTKGGSSLVVICKCLCLVEINKFLLWLELVSFAAVFRLVTQRSSSAAVCGEERCVTSLKTAAKETRLECAELNHLSDGIHVFCLGLGHTTTVYPTWRGREADQAKREKCRW